MNTATSSIVADLPVARVPASVQRGMMMDFATDTGRKAFAAITAEADRLGWPILHKRDLTEDNRRALAAVNAPRSFIWAIHQAGTHLIRLDRMTDVNWGASAARLSGPQAKWFRFDGDRLLSFDRGQYTSVALAEWSERRCPGSFVAVGQAVRSSDQELALVRSVERDGDRVVLTGHVLHLGAARQFHHLWSTTIPASESMTVLVQRDQSPSCASDGDAKH